ncbi:SIR2 family protein [Serratia marcescens]|uniref:SIR2 family protein n=2 Tax=Serratia marcescens TaxID=615 RepID=UPI0017603FCA|nr:SIR2 family protein [Serratia marcescens]MBN5294084.1 SIR2 family protein [Serratia marcescens]MCK1089325.1 SIR2 family protein [Serratia marcescens]QLJ24674.1 SIR2 family protein [Serratia marcescens]QLJ28691.1 SIR2 family protein [Serratia marcescens]QLJ33436.1 SIR2 family protein [Serratia marcescens]
MTKVFPKEALLNAILEITKKKKPISFVFGSPLASPDKANEPGVPDVNGMLLLIEKEIEEAGGLEQYKNETAGVSGAEKYQKSFEFICGWYSQDLANSIIEKAISSGCSRDGSIKYPDSLNQFAEFIKKQNIIVNSIITTNFDPLIETCFDKNNIKHRSYTLTSDGSIIKPITDDENEKIDIYHIHGFWKDSDTLHTSSQLTQPRPHLTASLKNIIGESSVIVIGYGGWDDIFTNSIKEILYDKNIKTDILWGFYEANPVLINNTHAKLFETVSSALIGNRFRNYCNINCKLFFKELSDYFQEKNNFPISIDKKAISEAKDNISKDLLNNDLKSTDKHIDESVNLKRIYIEREAQHNTIRVFERQQSLSSLEKSKLASIVSTLGCNKNGFLSSIIYSNDLFIKLPIYRIDASGIDNIENFHEEFKKQVGVYLAPFISIHAQRNGCILIIDNIIGLDLVNWKTSLNELINTILNNSHEIYVMLLGDNTLDKLSLTPVKLTSLDNPDCYEYISTHPDSRPEFLESSNFHKIIEITQSLPDKIDALLFDLRIMTLDDYLENPDDEDYANGDFGSELSNSDYIIPKYFQDIIYEFSISEKKENQDCYSILKVLTILEYGETFKNIRRYYSGYKFKKISLHRLINLGLVNVRQRTITLKNELRPDSSIVITINPLISSYMMRKINHEEANEITKEGLELSLGLNWMSGEVKLNNSVKEQTLESHSYGPGNVHSLICSFMRNSIREQLKRELKAIFYAALCYLDFLYDKGRFNDVVLSSKEIFSICEDFNEIIPSYKVLILKAKGLRMLSMYEESEKDLNFILDNEECLSNSEKISIHLELAHIKESEDNESETLRHVRVIRKLANRKTASWISAESIIAKFLPTETRLGRLKWLQQRAKKLNYGLTANNISLDIASELKDATQKNDIYNEVIHSTYDGYTKIRALIRKAKSYISHGKLDNITPQDRSVLKDAYIYLFTQRLEKMTESCHDVLWDIYSNEGNIQSLLNLYRHSAINWWLNGKKKRDYKFLSDLYSKKDLFENSDYNVLFVELVVTRMDSHLLSSID